MDHFRNSYNQINKVQATGWYGDSGNQASGDLGRMNPSRSWNGWSYGGLPLPQYQQSNNTGNNVNYVQLNWNDILGAGAEGQPITTSGSSAFQLAPPQNSGIVHKGYAKGRGGHQQQPRATFSVSLGNKGDNGSDSNQVANPNYEIISPQNPSPNSSGDHAQQLNSNHVGNQNPGFGGNHGQNLTSTNSLTKTTAEKYPPCGKCKACKYQQDRKPPSSRFGSYLIRNMDSRKC